MTDVGKSRVHAMTVDPGKSIQILKEAVNFSCLFSVVCGLRLATRAEFKLYSGTPH